MKTTKNTSAPLETAAQKQLKVISVDKIKEIIEKIEPDYYKRMIIQEDKIERTNYYYLKYSGKEVERFGKKIEFPLFGPVIQKFKPFQKAKDVEKMVMKSSEILDLLKKTYKILPQNEDLTKVPDWQSFPVNTDKQGAIEDEQDEYFFPTLTGTVLQEAVFRMGSVMANIEGDFGSLVYVESTLENHQVEKLLIRDGEAFDATIEEEINNHCNHQLDTKLVFRDFGIYDQANNKPIINYDTFSEELCEKIRVELRVENMHEEQIYYQIIPCIQLSYLHALNNTEHVLTMIDIWDAPEIIFHSSPEDTRRGLNDAAKNVSGFFSKLVNKKAHQSKEDRKNEIFLMLRIVLADGIVTEGEKEALSELVGGLDDFTSTEKQRFYDMMDAGKLPPISEDEVRFSDEETKIRVLQNLEKISKADGEVAVQEDRLLDKIKRMVNKVNA